MSASTVHPAKPYETKQTMNADYSAQYDYVMVFKTEAADGKCKQPAAAKACMTAMIAAGLEIFPYKSCQEDEIFVLIRAPLSKLTEFADVEDCLLRADESFLEKTLKAGDAEARIAPVEIKDDRRITPYSPYQHIYLEFNRKQNVELYHKSEGEVSPFSKSVRLKLILDILKASKRAKGCNLAISKLIFKGHILALFPLHDRSITKQLKAKCTTFWSMPWDVPTHDIKEYFGEKIALYTVFLGHYSAYSILPSVIGVAFQLVVWSTGDYSHPVLPFYSLVITVWSIAMLEYWKRQEATTALEWGMSRFEKQEQERPEFRGKLTKSHINGQVMLYYPWRKHAKLQVFSRTVVSVFIVVLVGVVTGIYVLRFSLQQRSDTNAYSSTIASVLNAVQIQVFNLIYQKMSVRLTDNENHRTDTQYEDSMITKLFVFQFINSYSSFFFLAFIATYLTKPDAAEAGTVGQCAAENCMEPLAINLAIIFGTRLFLNNLLDVVLPYISYRNKLKVETSGVEEVRLTPAEEDFMLLPYDSLLESINAYADTAIQYGYALLFITALPIATFCSLLNNWARVKFYLYKLFKFHQRPASTGAQDIGTWFYIFQFLSIAAVVTNAGLICFTMDLLWHRFTLSDRVWIFFGFQWVLLLAQFCATQFIEDVPPEVSIQLERCDFITEKVIEKVADDDFGEPRDLEDDALLGEEKKAQRGCYLCACCLPSRAANTMSSSAKIANDTADFGLFEYPRQAGAGDTWPGPLCSKNKPAAMTHQQQENQHQHQPQPDVPQSNHSTHNNHTSNYAHNHNNNQSQTIVHAAIPASHPAHPHHS